jgi:hypothetical protein
MKSPSKILLAAALVALMQWGFTQRAAAQSTNLYQVFYFADGVTTNNIGRLAGTFASSRDIVRKCAADNGITNANTLALVYDRDTDALEVVNRSDGSLVCTPFSFSDGTALPNSSGTLRERLALVHLDGSGEVAGSLRASESYRYDVNGEVVRFWIRGRLQFAVTGDATRTKIYTASFSTGSCFRPGTWWGH